MASTVEFPNKINSVFYHQEFDLDLFRPAPVGQITKITSFVNLLPRPDLYNSLKKELPDFEFRAYGQQCPDGIINKQKDIAVGMQQSGWGYHFKPLCDGYGHIIHNWFAVGKPVIANVREYKNYLAGQLMKEDINCISLDSGQSIKYIAQKIQEYSNTEKYDQMAKEAYRYFLSVVDFEKEQKDLKSFFDWAI